MVFLLTWRGYMQCILNLTDNTGMFFFRKWICKSTSFLIEQMKINKKNDQMK